MNELNSQETTRISTTLGTSRAQTRSGQDATRSSQAPADSAQSGNPLPGRGEALPSAEASTRGGAVDEAVVALNDYVQSVERNIRFTFDDDLGRSIVSVVDSETEQVIRQIPNDVAIRLARNLKTELEERAEAPVANPAQSSGSGFGGTLSFIDTTV